MKKIYKIALTLAAVFALNLTASAQKTKADGDGPAPAPDGLVLDKTVKPDPNKPGSYIINMEAYVEGGIHLTSKVAPADIVLVLDKSGSMDFEMGTGYKARPKMGYSYNSAAAQRSWKIGLDYGTHEYWYKHTDGRYYEVEEDERSGRYYLYYEVQGVKYYLSGNGTTNQRPNNAPRDPDATIWTGVLYSEPNRMAALQDAVKSFIEVIDQNDRDNAPEGSEDGRLGNKIAIVSYSTAAKVDMELTPLSGTGKQDLIEAVYNIRPNGSTYSNKGMEEAYNIINTKSTAQFKTVVFFTDGDPGQAGNWTTDDTWDTANNTIHYASLIKAKAVDSEDIDEKVISNVYALGVFENPSNQTKTYMSATSSNYDKTADSMGSMYGMRVQDTNGNTVSQSDTKYSAFATDSDKINEILTDIAGSSGGQALEAASQSSVMIDVVTNSFKIPDNAGSKLTAYEVANIQTEAGAPVWSTTKGTTYTVVRSESDPNEVSVTGFDYSKNWVGWDDKNKEAHGKKLVLEIPIDVNPEAVGGPTVYTNDARKTKITIKKNAQDPGIDYAFPAPSVALPVTIKIQKSGLQTGESAKFTISRWIGEDSSTATPFQTIVLTKTEKDKNPEIILKGLDPKYYYKIDEVDWAWSYQYLDPETQKPVEVSSQNTQNTEVNPFIFYNKKNNNVDKHAESSAHNVLKATSK